ncbi:MAG: hypothetical protein GYA36_22685 [Veillonellaceae bacterium]|nr:hypothetical protein [Veillonellaceae bacterium]
MLLLTPINNCPYCECNIDDRYQTICYECGYFILLHQIFTEREIRKEQLEELKSGISKEIDNIVDKGQQISPKMKVAYRDKIDLAKGKVDSVFDEALEILTFRRRHLLIKGAENINHKLEISAIDHQAKEIARKGGKFLPIKFDELNIDLVKFLVPLAEASKAALKNLEKGNDFAILGAVAGFLEGLQKTNINQKEKTKLENDLELMRDRVVITGAAIKSKRELAEHLSENIIQLDERLKDMGVPKPERVRRIDDFLNSLYEQQIIDNKEPYN